VDVSRAGGGWRLLVGLASTGRTQEPGCASNPGWLNLRTGMQTLFRDLAITTGAA
jgi:hypothetical protein